ncbi:MAG: hypothetical protein OEV64_10155 [Desulfobulbaceae bacterium]|nr:hypothetical protein [Desulfobulbaceae bacterium]
MTTVIDSTAPHLPHNADSLVPHEPPMLLVDRVVQVVPGDDSEAWSIVEAKVPEKGIFVTNGRVLPEYLIELTAQAIAAADGYENLRLKLTSVVGFLVGVQDFVQFSEPLPAQSLRIELNKSFSFGAMMIFNVAVYAGDTSICRGEIKIWKEESR